VTVDLTVTDIRPPSLIGEYTAQLSLELPLRLTDKINGPSGREDGTLSDSTLRVPVQCSSTADTTIGGLCSLATTADSVIPGLVTESRRTI
jgi:hypothetical protein